MPILRQAPSPWTWYYVDYRSTKDARLMLILGVRGARYRHVEEHKSHEQDVGTGRAGQVVDRHWDRKLVGDKRHNRSWLLVSFLFTFIGRKDLPDTGVLPL